MTDEDSHAFTPAHQPRPPAPRRLWPWVLAGMLLVALLVAGLVTLGGMGLTAAWDAALGGTHIVINGDDLDLGWSGASFGVPGLLGLLLALVLGLLVLCSVVPLTLLLVALGLVTALLLAPLWGLLLLAWLLLRPRRAARMQA